MEIKFDNFDYGFQFFGQFEFSVMGVVGKELECELLCLFELVGFEVLIEWVSWKYLFNGKYVLVWLVFKVDNCEQYDVVYIVLCDYLEVKWMLQVFVLLYLFWVFGWCSWYGCVILVVSFMCWFGM